MFRTILLFPFMMVGHLALGSIHLTARVVLGVYRVCDGGVRGAVLMAMAVTALHIGISVLIGRTDLPARFFEGTVIGAVVGIIYGVHRAWTRPQALPTPAAFRPSFGQSLLRAGYGLGRSALRVVAVFVFLSLVSAPVALHVASNFASAGDDPNPPQAAKIDLSIIDHGHAALVLAGAEEPEGTGFRLEARPVLLASLTKVYADPRFSELAVARAEFRNSTGAPVTDYRVRFRLTDYTADWSPWSGSAQVGELQTVTTPYFPILDEPRLAQLEGFALVDLRVEHEYRKADGRLIQQQEIRRVKVMARNWMAFWHSVPEEEAEALMQDPASRPWREAYATMPLLLPAFVTKDDPVIQQVAGWVSGQAGGAPIDDAGARRFMQALYEFMVANDIRYQLPAGGDRDGWAVQHVHYGRDVLRNRAGCCIDLTIFYASVCEAVNLEPVLILVPGHIFPAIRLPESKQLVPVEVTNVNNSRPQDGLAYLESGYAAAVVVATMELEQARQGVHLEVDIAAQRKSGIQALQLPPLPPNVLAGWGIHPVEPTPLWQVLAYWAAVIGGVFLVRRLWQQRRLARQLRDTDPEVRFQAVTALAHLSGRWSTRMLRRALADESEPVRQAAETVLQVRGEEVPVAVGPEARRVGLPSLGASRRALLALAAGEFNSVVMDRPPAASRSDV